MFFFASAGVSAAYLTVREIFPLETRALCIALFYAVGTGLGGIIGPLLFAPMVATRQGSECSRRWRSAPSLMIVGGVTEILFGVASPSGAGLELIAKPLTAVTSAARGGVARAGSAARRRSPSATRASESA